jgi:maltose O-acetyltransferase
MIKKILKKILRIKPKEGKRFGDNVKIGKNVSFGKNITIFKTATVEIGDYTMIACNVTIHTSTHDYDSHPMSKYRIDRPIKIGKHTWIGIGAILLPGVIIGDYAVVGAGSVVTSHVPKGAIVVGIPAKIIKKRNLEKIKETVINNENIIITKNYLERNKICKNLKKS